MESSKSKQRQEDIFTRPQLAPTRHGECIYLRGELRRPNPSELTWQKPTGEESSTRYGEHTYSRGELSQRKKYKRPFIHIRAKYHIISHHSIGGHFRGETGGKPERL